jgi:aminobenzoyl-glutamate utilization protein B
MTEILDNHTALATSLLGAIEARASTYTRLSDQIWGFAEVGFNEKRSASAQMSLLAEEGFTIKADIGGIPTAFVAEKGDGGPIIGILGEFDALAGMSQIAGMAKSAVLTKGEAGHGCGHNLLGSGSALAAVAC